MLHNCESSYYVFNTLIIGFNGKDFVSHLTDKATGFCKIMYFSPTCNSLTFYKTTCSEKILCSFSTRGVICCENRTVFCGILSYPRVSLDFSEARLYIQAAVTAALRNPLLKGHVSLFLKSRDEIEPRRLLSNWSPATRSGLKTLALCSDMAGL